MTYTFGTRAAFGRYVADPRARPQEDLVGYRQAGLWLDEDERAELVERLRSAISPYLENAETPARQHALLSTVLIPELAVSPLGSETDSDR